MNSEHPSLFEFVEHPMTCGHCGAEITVINHMTQLCPHCLHEEKSVGVQLQEALDKLVIIEQKLAITEAELQQFKEANNREVENMEMKIFQEKYKMRECEAINDKPTPEQRADRPTVSPPAPPSFCVHCLHLIKEYEVGDGTNVVHLCCFCGIERVTFVPKNPEYFSIKQREHGAYIQSGWSV